MSANSRTSKAWRGHVTSGLLLTGMITLLTGCGSAPAPLRAPTPTCVSARLDAAQQLYFAAKANLVRHYKERSAVTLQAAFYFAGDAMQVARASRFCPEFDTRARSAAINIVRLGRSLRSQAFQTMRDPDPWVAQSLLQEQYTDAFAGRDLD